MTIRKIEENDGSFKCVACGSSDYSVVKQDDENPRLRCSTCNFIFSGKDSEEAERAGQIPLSSKETLANAVSPETEIAKEKETLQYLPSSLAEEIKISKPKPVIPNQPKYVFIAKFKNGDQRFEFCSQRDLKKMALKWESFDHPYTLFELTKKKSDVKVSIE